MEFLLQYFTCLLNNFSLHIPYQCGVGSIRYSLPVFDHAVSCTEAFIRSFLMRASKFVGIPSFFRSGVNAQDLPDRVIYRSSHCMSIPTKTCFGERFFDSKAGT